MNSTHFAASVQLNIDSVVRFSVFCDVMDLSKETRRHLKESLEDDNNYVDLGQKHGGCVMVQTAWEHLRMITDRLKEERMTENKRKAKSCKKRAI